MDNFKITCICVLPTRASYHTSQIFSCFYRKNGPSRKAPSHETPHYAVVSSLDSVHFQTNYLRVICQSAAYLSLEIKKFETKNDLFP